jgi:NhaA family Na+:H+ antiporter
MSDPHEYPLERLFGRIRSPLELFLRRTSAGSIVLVAATVVSLLLASTLGQEAVEHFWEGRLSTQASGYRLDLTWHQWVNDGLMAIFFLVVGLELKREMLVGELSSMKDAALPVFAAVGGMVVPAGIYAAFNVGTSGAPGWGIPMATDIAFAVGILVLLGWRVPRNLVIFLMALAIADDLGAVLVIALFYTSSLNGGAAAAAAVIYALLWLFNRAGIRNPLVYGLMGVLLWRAVLGSGVHATIAGILLAMVIPARPYCSAAQFERRLEELLRAFRVDRRDPSTTQDPLGNKEMASIAEAVESTARAVQSPLQRIEHRVSPWVTFMILPLFALSNAGIDLGAVRWGEALGERVTLGVLLGLAVGKVLGIAGASWLAVRLGVGRLPADVSWTQLVGAAWLGGIGFTMSLFIAQLAFRDPMHVEQAKIGILLGSLVAAIAGLAWLYVTAARQPRPS